MSWNCECVNVLLEFYCFKNKSEVWSIFQTLTSVYLFPFCLRQGPWSLCICTVWVWVQQLSLFLGFGLEIHSCLSLFIWCHLYFFTSPLFFNLCPFQWWEPHPDMGWPDNMWKSLFYVVVCYVLRSLAYAYLGLHLYLSPHALDALFMRQVV